MRQSRKMILEAQELLKSLNTNILSDEAFINSEAMRLLLAFNKQMDKYYKATGSIMPPDKLEEATGLIKSQLESMEHREIALNILDIQIAVMKIKYRDRIVYDE